MHEFRAFRDCRRRLQDARATTEAGLAGLPIGHVLLPDAEPVSQISGSGAGVGDGMHRCTRDQETGAIGLLAVLSG